MRLFFHFVPDRRTALALALGAVSVATSFTMLFAPSGTATILLRDVLQIGLIGFIAPALIMGSKDRRDFGLRLDGWRKPFAIGLGISAVFTAYIHFSNPAAFVGILHAPWTAIVYIMIANVFEVFFFFVYLRGELERAFGVIPAVVVAALAYAFHHAGFQPEYLKLFAVGLIFITIYRLVGHWLVMFPLWWIGGLWDVLVQSKMVGGVSSLGLGRVVIIGAFTLAAVAIAIFKSQPKIVSE